MEGRKERRKERKRKHGRLKKIFKVIFRKKIIIIKKKSQNEEGLSD